MRQDERFGKPIGEWVRVTIVLSCAVLLASCSVSPRISAKQRSAVEQQPLALSLERAFAQLDTARLGGKSAALEVYGLTNDRQFAEEYLAAGIQERGLKLATGSDEADLRLKVFLTTFGIDTGETLLGIPAFSAPVIDLPVPEIALFKSDRHRGHTQLRLYAFDESTQRLIEKSPLIDRRSKFDNYKVLLLIKFNIDDLDEEADQADTNKS